MKLYKCEDGRCNTSGSSIRELREAAGWSQEQLAGHLQLLGLNLNQKAISRIETGDRVVPDFELLFFSKVFHVSLYRLLAPEDKGCDDKSTSMHSVCGLTPTNSGTFHESAHCQ